MVNAILGFIAALLFVVFVQQMQMLSLLRDLSRHLTQLSNQPSLAEQLTRLQRGVASLPHPVPAPHNTMK